MSTVQQFKDWTFGRLVKMIGDRQEYAQLKSDLSHCVPIYGMIRSWYTDYMGDDNGGCDTIIYFADQSGMVFNFCGGTDEESARKSAIEQIALLLGVSPEEIKASSGHIHETEEVETIGTGFVNDDDEYDVDWEHGTEATDYLWSILYVEQDVFERIHKERHVSLIAEDGDQMDDHFERIVAPQPVRVKDAPFDFDLGLAMIRFVAGHKNCIEYETQDGIRVFDNRKKRLGVACYSDGTEIPIISRQEALDEFVRVISREKSNGRETDEQKVKLRRFTISALSTLVHSPEHMRCSGELISKGIEALCGNSYFHAGRIFGITDWRGDAVSDKDHQKPYQKRMLFKDEEWGEDDLPDDDRRPNPRYVVVND